MEYDVVRLVQLPNGLQIDITTKVLRNPAVCAILFLWNLRNARKPPVLGQLDGVPEKSSHGRGFPSQDEPKWGWVKTNSTPVVHLKIAGIYGCSSP